MLSCGVILDPNMEQVNLEVISMLSKLMGTKKKKKWRRVKEIDASQTSSMDYLIPASDGVP